MYANLEQIELMCINHDGQYSKYDSEVSIKIEIDGNKQRAYFTIENKGFDVKMVVNVSTDDIIQLGEIARALVLY